MAGFVGTKPKREYTPRTPKPKLTKEKLIEKVIEHLKPLENKHAKYIVKCLTSSSNNNNFLGYKLEYLLEVLPTILEGMK